MTKEQKDKILKALAEDRNHYARDCNMRIEKEYGRIDGADFMLQRFLDVLSTEVEPQESEEQDEEEKTAHWEWVQYDSNPNIGNWQCSECRCVVIECCDKKSKGDIPLYKYCPQCGCSIVEPQESEVSEC